MGWGQQQVEIVRRLGTCAHLLSLVVTVPGSLGRRPWLADDSARNKLRALPTVCKCKPVGWALVPTF